MVGRLAPLPRVQGLRAAVGVAGGAAYLGFIQLWNPTAPHFFTCPIHAATGLWCPGCGSTRAMYALTHGRALDALHNNVLVPFALVILVYCALWSGSRIPARWIQYGAALVMVFALARNLAPFGFLTPLTTP